jgi:hypothetical protein
MMNEYFADEAHDFCQPDSGGSPATEGLAHITPWERAEEHIRGLLQIKDNWDGEGPSAARQELVCSALHLAKKLAKDGDVAPQDAYLLPDGNIMLEWQFPDGRIVRIEIEEAGRGQRMTTFAKAPAQFDEIIWEAPSTTVSRESSGKDEGSFAVEWNCAPQWHSETTPERGDWVENVCCPGFDLAA